MALVGSPLPEARTASGQRGGGAVTARVRSLAPDVVPSPVPCGRRRNPSPRGSQGGRESALLVPSVRTTSRTGSLMFFFAFGRPSNTPSVCGDPHRHRLPSWRTGRLQRMRVVRRPGAVRPWDGKGSRKTSPSHTHQTATRRWGRGGGCWTTTRRSRRPDDAVLGTLRAGWVAPHQRLPVAARTAILPGVQGRLRPAGGQVGHDRPVIGDRVVDGS